MNSGFDKSDDFGKVDEESACSGCQQSTLVNTQWWKQFGSVKLAAWQHENDKVSNIAA